MKKKMIRLPKKIEHCPIVDATFGINFESNLTSDAIFDVLFDKLKSKYPNSENLPLSFMPSEITSKDIRFKYQAKHKISNDNFAILIGSNTFSISHNSDYKGWDFFVTEIKDCVSILKDSSIISEIKRLGLRYIDVFEGIDIFDKIRHHVDLKSNSTHLRTKIINEPFYHLLQITNDSKFLNKNNEEKQGSLIDIDSTLSYYRNNELDFIDDFLEQAHQKEKELFFDLLKEDFLKSLNPIYDEEI